MRKRRYEAIASTRKGRHVSGARRTITERLAKRGDLKPEGSFIDSAIWPYPFEQFALADNLTGAFHQNNENVERSSAEMKRSLGPLENSSRDR
jgi:hypothetical protein